MCVVNSAGCQNQSLGDRSSRNLVVYRRANLIRSTADTSFAADDIAGSLTIRCAFKIALWPRFTTGQGCVRLLAGKLTLFAGFQQRNFDDTPNLGFSSRGSESMARHRRGAVDDTLQHERFAHAGGGPRRSRSLTAKRSGGRRLLLGQSAAQGAARYFPGVEHIQPVDTNSSCPDR